MRWEIQPPSILPKVRYMTDKMRMCCFPNFRKESIDVLFADDASIRSLDLLKANGVEAVTPPKLNRTEKRDYDRGKYKWRYLIGNLFQKLNQFGGATRYDKLTENLHGRVTLPHLLFG